MKEREFSLLSELYVEYNQTLKPLIATVESLYEKFPTPIFNEIRSFNDHIARCFREKVNDQIINEQLKKAKSHQKRAIFDCFKFLNVEYYKEVKKFEKQARRINLTAIDNGNFWLKYRELKQEAENYVRDAKKIETIDFLKSYDLFQNAASKYDDLLDFISKNNTKIIWAKCKFITVSFFKILLIIVGTLLGGVVSNLIANYYNTTILEFLQSFF